MTAPWVFTGGDHFRRLAQNRATVDPGKGLMRKPLSAALFLSLAAFAQMQQLPVAPPSDPLDPVTSGAQPITTVEQRAALTGLMNRAMDQYAMHAKGTPAHVLQI